MASRTSSRAIARSWLIGSIVVLGVVPLALDRDSFPLSTYPMFSSNRSTREPVDTAFLIAPDGTESRLDPRTIAGTDEPIIATVVVGESIADGSVDQLCAEIAARVEDASGSKIEVVTVVYDALDWFAGRRDPVSRVVHGSCPVPAS